jgi:hypothetical protein
MSEEINWPGEIRIVDPVDMKLEAEAGISISD